jgi:hypothetical protein
MDCAQQVGGPSISGNDAFIVSQGALILLNATIAWLLARIKAKS